MGEGTDRSVTDVSPALPADLVALRSELEEKWRTMLQQMYDTASAIESMTGRPAGHGMPRLVDVLYTLSTLPRAVFLKELEESPDSVIRVVKQLLGLAVGEMAYRIRLDEVTEMGATRIEWVENPDGTPGKSWNPIAGCTKVGEGCENCYAERMAVRLAGMSRADRAKGREPGRKEKYECVVTPGGQWNRKVVYDPSALGDLGRWKNPQTIFVCSMSDLFQPGVSKDYIGDVFAAMIAQPQHRYIVLTKRPHRIALLLHPLGIVPTSLPNLWFGFSAENQATFHQRARFLRSVSSFGWNTCASLEPLLGPIRCGEALTWLQWVIVGSETGVGARRADLAWVERIVEECRGAGVSCFVKQVGTVPGPEIGKLPNSVQVREWPEGLRVQGSGASRVGESATVGSPSVPREKTSKRSSVLEQLRRAIKADKQGPYRIARIVRMDDSELYRFLTGERGLPFYRAEAVAEAIGMEIVLFKTDDWSTGD